MYPSLSRARCGGPRCGSPAPARRITSPWPPSTAPDDAVRGEPPLPRCPTGPVCRTSTPATSRIAMRPVSCRTPPVDGTTLWRATPLPPPASVTVTTDNGGRQFVVDWQPPADAGDAIGVVIARADRPSFEPLSELVLDDATGLEVGDFLYIRARSPGNRTREQCLSHRVAGVGDPPLASWGMRHGEYQKAPFADDLPGVVRAWRDTGGRDHLNIKLEAGASTDWWVGTHTGTAFENVFYPPLEPGTEYTLTFRGRAVGKPYTLNVYWGRGQHNERLESSLTIGTEWGDHTSRFTAPAEMLSDGQNPQRQSEAVGRQHRSGIGHRACLCRADALQGQPVRADDRTARGTPRCPPPAGAFPSGQGAALRDHARRLHGRVRAAQAWGGKPSRGIAVGQGVQRRSRCRRVRGEGHEPMDPATGLLARRGIWVARRVPVLALRRGSR